MRALADAALVLAVLAAAGCRSASPPEAAFEAGRGSDADSDSDSDADSGVDSGPGDAGPVEIDCSECPAVGPALEHLICALDLCDEAMVVDQSYASPMEFTGCSLEDTYEAVERFGDATNDLAPRLNGSYTLMATGPATGTEHSTACTEGPPLEDPYLPEDESPVFDVIEWTLVVVAPDEARAFSVDYVFFSEDYDDFIGQTIRDKFYIVLEAGSTNGGEPTVINFGPCRDPETVTDFVCGPEDVGCRVGEPCCMISVNSAFSECCWYHGCPDGTWTTDISGTGFSCAAYESEDSHLKGSSTGWLRTSWPIDGGETFAVTFRLHETADAIFDSEVILDAFRFWTEEHQGTRRLE